MKSRTIMKKVVSTAIVSIMTLSLAACGGSPSSEGGEAKSEDDGKSVTLEFQQWWGPEMPEGTLKEICDDFTKESGIGIELLSNP
ncbi:MAG: sugar ABC transporter substrate-binding protein, partial [Lachnospiraceae bacterium]|nr:sugar ABC transporter substrate-binding protein [Lachnospiraceae bacterium]